MYRSVVAWFTAACLGVSACGAIEVPTQEFTSSWTAPDGAPADRGPREFEVRAMAGSDHCEWGSVVFLTVAWPPGTTYMGGPDAPETRQYVRDAHGDLSGAAERLRGELDLDAELPDAAEDTGYVSAGGAELWINPEKAETHIYVVVEDKVERWPRAEPPIACA